MTTKEAMPRTVADALPGDSLAVPPFRHVLNPASFRAYDYGARWPVYVKVEWDGKRLSLSGVEGPKHNGDSYGSAGQIRPDDTYEPEHGWTAESAARLWELWDRWHLNDIRAGCEHQRANWNTTATVEVVTYKLTTEAFHAREKAIAYAAECAARGEPADLTPTARALVLLSDWFKDRHEPPDADSPLSGCFEVRKRETRHVGHVRPTEHPQGLLSKPCEVCGYKYGNAWLTENVPEDVLRELRAFPQAKHKPAWV